MKTWTPQEALPLHETSTLTVGTCTARNMKTPRSQPTTLVFLLIISYEAKALRKMMPVAQRVLGCNDRLTLTMKRLTAVVYKDSGPPRIREADCGTRNGPPGACSGARTRSQRRLGVTARRAALRTLKRDRRTRFGQHAQSSPRSAQNSPRRSPTLRGNQRGAHNTPTKIILQ